MKHLIRTAGLAMAVAVVAGCDTGPKGSAGFTLPEGNAEQGKAHYIALGCNACHQHAEVPQADTPLAEEISIALGGESGRVRTYGELVTSVINPSHRVARRGSEEMADASGNSRMSTFNDTMTVTQMVDLVAFLQASYTLSPYQNTAYPVYWHPGDEG